MFLKKTRELASIVEDLKEAFDIPGSGNFPNVHKVLDKSQEKSSSEGN